MHEAGARVFVEVGPQGVLTGLTAQILAGKPHLALASDAKSRPGLVQLAHLLGQLLSAGVSANLDRLFAGRAVQPFDLAKLNADTGKPKHAATTWLVNGVRSRPLNGPEPRLLGQALRAGEVSSAKSKADAPARPTPPAPLPEGRGEKASVSPQRPASASERSSSSPLPSGRGAGG